MSYAWVIGVLIVVICALVGLRLTGRGPIKTEDPERYWVKGTIQKIYVHMVPSKFVDVPERPECRIDLDVEDHYMNRHPRGLEWGGVGKDFHMPRFAGPVQLCDRFKAGDRVIFGVTGPTSYHIATIRLAPKP